MCGIAGLVLRAGLRPDPARVARMAALLAHRGPDDQGVQVADNVGLAQTRLSIIGLATGHQPMLSADGSLALAANGEVYNYLELNAALAAQGAVARTGSDSETILLAYGMHGLDCLAQLRGMFAFALHDRPRGRMILARDRLGIKPLFYTRLADGIAFASELKPLLPLLPGRPELRPAGLVQYLQQQFAGGRETVFMGIERVLPGEVLIIDDALRIERHRYWSPLDIRPIPMAADEALAALDGLLADLMREHMRADVPFGLFLSGGLDSAVLAALLYRHGAGRIQSFSVGYQDTAMADELDAAASVARHFGFAHRPLRLTRQAVLGRLPRAIWAADELMRDFASLPTLLLAEAASAELKVVFSGEGGDEVFAGYRRYRPTLPERLVKGLLAPGSGGFRTRGQWHSGWARRLFGPALGTHPGTGRNAFIAAWRETPVGWSDLMRRQYVDLATALPDNLLVKTDRLLMAFGLEGRVPFLDHRLVAFGLGLPDALKVRGRVGKWLLREWARPLLPAGHLARPKRGFHVPIGDWLRGPVAVQAGQLLVRNRGIQEWFQVDGVAALAVAGRHRELFSLIQFAIWHRLFVEGNGAIPGAEEDPLPWIADP